MTLPALVCAVAFMFALLYIPTNMTLWPADKTTCKDYNVATKEFIRLLDCLQAAGLHTEVRPGYELTILICVKASEQLLGNAVYKQRLRTPPA